ncbi:lipocalin family protein [Mangrovimonas sp. YM274]|uniref:lipocalin family protein n=1 Tax=Mangrovimonas sp. YM274 TaxID=3070660 RepID=UPI0027DE2F71|nr:lipocalin family protein [Mangrovimonas sp. YM274]WMI69006.1 hypothetical protein RBH95_01230 [Mangrovimonas sp. YM274]
MTNLFKNLTIILNLVLITACSSDDSQDSNSSVDPLIGTWQYVTQFENDVQYTANDCSPSTIVFTQSGNRTDAYYDTNNTGDCVVVDTVNMTWQQLNDGTYQFTQNGYSFSETVLFSENNNTLTLEDTDEDGNGNVITYSFIYTRTE